MKSIHFPSKISPTPAFLPDRLIEVLSRCGAWACRNAVVEGAGLTALCPILEHTGDLTANEKGLGGLFAKAYAQIAVSPSFAFTASAVPFCLSKKPEGGHYFLHVPKVVNDSTPVLLLLHGYGGNLLYFPWAIWKEQPDAVIIAPSWQVHWSDGTFEDRQTYVHETIEHAEKTLGSKLGKPWLVPLSQGGGMAFQLAGADPGRYRGLVGISTGADSVADAERIDSKFQVALIHGGADERIKCDWLHETFMAIKNRGGDPQLTIIDPATHFLLLSHRERVGRFLAESIGRN